MARPGSGGPNLRRLNMGQIFIILAVVSAILTIFIFKSMMSQKSPDKAVEMKTKPVVVATHQLFSGEVITEDSLKVIEWPADHYPQTGVYDDSKKLIGRVVKKDVLPGQPVFRLNLAGKDSDGGMPVVIPPGHRAMTILVSESKGVAGFVKPGDMVDILGTFRFQLPEATQRNMSQNSGPLLESSIDISQTVLQNVKILATAQTMIEKNDSLKEELKSGNEAKKPDKEVTTGRLVSSVTVAVTPEQAEKLALADERGSLRLVLRPENESEESHLIGAVTADLVPLQNVLEKALQIRSSFDSSAISGEFSTGSQTESEKIPEPAIANVPPPRPMREVQVFEGTEMNNVSF